MNPNRGPDDRLRTILEPMLQRGPTRNFPTFVFS
jgi:hypothetical protein